ncbi:putative protein FAM47D [Mugil cephalus]|uniref:putative protein FAM47D n=1 Tax=Mugil cephalus TaxID=48193 RepID=UPI001FB6DC31|nr:putative protein FAM47D [Mugil cephalus]
MGDSKTESFGNRLQINMSRRNTRPVFPWYKERLQTKYLKNPTSKQSFVSSSWHFGNTSPSDCSSAFLGAQGGVSPGIFEDPSHQNSHHKPKKSISKEQACFSKQMIQKQVRRDYVASLEEKLKKHPLAMYPHYKDHMTPELFDQVVSILDPDMCVNNMSELPATTGDHSEKEDEEDC